MMRRVGPVVMPFPADIDALRDIDLHLYGRLCAQGAAPDGLRPIPGEISEREGRVLYDLAARVWDGTGTVLELGTLFGASTQWLGLGMAANPAREGRLVAADAFLPYAAAAEMAREVEPLLGERPDRDVIVAELAQRGFRRAFEALHADGQPYSRFLTIEEVVVPGDPGHSTAKLEDFLRTSSPIAVLIIDSVKSWYPVRALALAAVEHLRAGALIAWQDHRWFNSFAIPYLNARFGGYMHLLAVVDSMHVYRYVGGLSARRIRQVMPEAAADVSPSELRDLFGELAWQCYLQNDAYGVLSASLQLAFALASQGHADEATALFDVARSLPGFAFHHGLFEAAQPEFEALCASSKIR